MKRPTILRIKKAQELALAIANELLPVCIPPESADILEQVERLKADKIRVAAVASVQEMADKLPDFGSPRLAEIVQEIRNTARDLSASLMPHMVATGLYQLVEGMRHAYLGMIAYAEI